MKKALLLLLVLGFIAVSYSNNVCLNVKGTVKFERSVISEAAIEVYVNGVADTIVLSNEKGKFNIQLKKNNQYKVVIKKEGYFAPVVLVNTTINDNEDYCWNYKFVIDLIPSINIAESKVFEKPIGYVAYNENLDDFGNEVNSNTIAKYREFIARYESVKESKYEKMISMADSAFLKHDCELALNLYSQAASINKNDTYADMQVELIEDFRLKYQKAIEQADGYYNKSELQKAKTFYLKAIEIKQLDYPMAQIEKIEKLIEDESILAAQ